jgi:hypothetical protein
VHCEDRESGLRLTDFERRKSLWLGMTDTSIRRHIQMSPGFSGANRRIISEYVDRHNKHSEAGAPAALEP